MLPCQQQVLNLRKLYAREAFDRTILTLPELTCWGIRASKPPKIANFLTCVLFASLSLILVPLACKGIQNGCPNGSGNHENGGLPAVPAESQEKYRFWTLFWLFLEHFFIGFCDVLDVCFEDI